MAQLACDLHDYIEIVCMFHYEVLLTLKDGQAVKGRASTTVRDAQSRECIRLVDCEKSCPLDVALAHLAHLQVLTPNARFSEVTFSDQTS